MGYQYGGFQGGGYQTSGATAPAPAAPTKHGGDDVPTVEYRKYEPRKPKEDPLDKIIREALYGKPEELTAAVAQPEPEKITPARRVKPKTAPRQIIPVMWAPEEDESEDELFLMLL
jgi:hypothetical protein